MRPGQRHNHLASGHLASVVILAVVILAVVILAVVILAVVNEFDVDGGSVGCQVTMEAAMEGEN